MMSVAYRADRRPDPTPIHSFARRPHPPRPYGSAALPGRLSFVILSTPERTALFQVGI
jgi:hypothetical protein